MSKVPCQTSSTGAEARWVATQSGIQSLAHPSSDCRSPATVTNCGAGVLASTAAGIRKTRLSRSAKKLHGVRMRDRTRGRDIWGPPEFNPEGSGEFAADPLL